MMEEIRIAIADDHRLLRKGLVQLLRDQGFNVVAEANNGNELITLLDSTKPHVVLMDISMPELNGIDTTNWLSKHDPAVRVIALSMFDDEKHIIQMIRAGARGYLLKDTEPAQLRRAIINVVEHGFHFSEHVSGKLVNHVTNHGFKEQTQPKLSEREQEFLKQVCSELTYKEIAAAMHVSPRTVDGYRDALFEKLGVKTRVGLALYAIRNGLVLV